MRKGERVREKGREGEKRNEGRKGEIKEEKSTVLQPCIINICKMHLVLFLKCSLIIQRLLFYFSL